MTAQRFFTHPAGRPLAALGATLLWGSAFPLIKLSYQHMDIHRDETFEQILFAGYRFTLAGLIILAMMILMRIPFDRNPRSWAGIAKVSAFQTVCQYLFFYIGLSYATGTISSIIAGTTSFFQLLVAHFLYRNDRLTPMRGLGVFVGFAGIAVIWLQGESSGFSFGFGEILLIVSMFFGGLGNVLAKKESAHSNIFFLTGLQMFLGGVVLLSVGAFQTGILPFHMDGQAIAMLIYLAILSSAGFLLWNLLMKYNSVSSVSMYLALIPLFGVILSSILLHERLHPTILVSLCLIIVGIVIVNRVRLRKESSKNA
ncbi:DMT family transporter [Cohnella pontilimi]|uniref:DMT family transporter n=1 Tax=Cohnella pontilimi TaxID=2564100 RepID=A0A4U0FDD0_9BACL|nr:DMT family transporter [Cohnella pontilimi]TJY41272.1 DMT family transporter [Cohnella pontilimi]